MSKLYTFIMNFCDGRYISQVHADDEIAAMKKWAHNINTAKIREMGEKIKSDLTRRIVGELPVKIMEREHVWSFLIISMGKSCEVDFVMTVPEKR